MNSGKCRGCGAPILWVRTAKGNHMPCEAAPVNFTPDIDGPERFLEEGGHVVRGRTVHNEFLDMRGVGFRPHWQFCPAASLFHSRGPKAGAAKRAQPKPEPEAQPDPLPTWEEMLADPPSEQMEF